MNYKNKINKITSSKLNKLSYLQQTPFYSAVSFPSNPDNFSASQQMQLYTSSPDTKFCMKCKSPNIEKNGEVWICKDCNSRFSDSHFQFSNTNSRETGLLDLDHAGEQSPQYHTDHQIGAGSASVSWGKGDK